MNSLRRLIHMQKFYTICFYEVLSHQRFPQTVRRALEQKNNKYPKISLLSAPVQVWLQAEMGLGNNKSHLLTAGLVDPCGSSPTQNILWISDNHPY